MTETQTMQEYIDDCYDNTVPGSLFELGVALPGYRIELVTADGRIGSYRDGGITPVAHCDLRYRHKARNLLEMMNMLQYRASSPALTHDRDCTYCGHRIVRSLKELTDFVAHVAEAKNQQTLFLNHAYYAGTGKYLAVVECSVPAGGLITHRNLKDHELPGTIRTNQLELGGTVYLPRFFGATDQRPVAQRIRERYGVKVRQPNKDALTLINSFTPTGRSGDGLHASGEWGTYGAAGVLFATGSIDEPRYLLAKRSHLMPNHPGLWGTPGGAMSETETTLGAATREVEEELGIKALGAASIAGSVRYDHPAGGWTYTTFLAHLSDVPAVKVDGAETVEARWFTRDELAGMANAGLVVPALVSKLPELHALHLAWARDLKGAK